MHEVGLQKDLLTRPTASRLEPLNLHLLKLGGRTTTTLTCADKATRCAISGWARTLRCSVEVPSDEDLLLPEQRERVQL